MSDKTQQPEAALEAVTGDLTDKRYEIIRQAADAHTHIVNILETPAGPLTIAQAADVARTAREAMKALRTLMQNL